MYDLKYMGQVSNAASALYATNMPPSTVTIWPFVNREFDETEK